MAGIMDVASALGVSSATVSRAMRDLPGVSADVRAKVLAKAAELNYVASRSASTLATGRTMTVGVLTPYIARWYFGHLVAHVESELSESGYDLLLYNVASDAARERFFERMPVRSRVDALVSFMLPNQAEAAALRSLAVPLALVGAKVDGFASFGIDDTEAAATAVRHLLNLGHRTIGLIGGGRDHVPMHFVTPVDRRAGFFAALAAAGIEHDPRLEANGEFTLEGGERAMNEILAAPTRPTAVFAQSDEMAIGALRAIRRHGLRVPEDISLIGFDDIDTADMLGLTTIAQPLGRLGQAVARSIIQQLAGEPVDTHSHTELPTRLIVRETTGPVAS